MKRAAVSRRVWKTFAPIVVFGTVWAAHYLWVVRFSGAAAAQSRWVSLDGPAAGAAWQKYLETQSQYLGFSYASSLAFGAYAWLRFREERCRPGRDAAVGSAAATGGLALFGCFLIGCCGSPLLSVYLSLFGASFLPIAKPLIAVLTALFALVAWARMNRARCGTAREEA